MNKEMISVIVPVYNVKKYIERCLKSLLYQTYTNIEIICIDDKSTDNSTEICEKFVKKDSRVSLIKLKQNSGQASARNIGIRKAHGKYIAFVDADDWVTSDYLETLYKLLIEYEADIVQASYLRTAIEIDENLLKSENKNIECMTGKRAIYKMFSTAMVRPDVEYSVVWNKLFRKSLIECIYFPEGKIYEDQYFSAMCFYNCQKVVTTDKKIYFYRKNLQGTTMQKYTIKFLDEIEIHEKLMKYFDKNKESDLLDTVSARDIPLAIDHFYYADYFENANAKRKAYMHVLKGYGYYLRSRKASLSCKFEVLLFLLCPSAFSDFRLNVNYHEVL